MAAVVGVALEQVSHQSNSCESHTVSLTRKELQMPWSEAEGDIISNYRPGQ